MDYKNKTVVITGAASGMALLSAKCYAEQGANVVMTDISEKIFEEAENICKNGGNAIGMIADVRDFSHAENVAKTAYEKFGSVDILINFAGGSAKRVFNYKGEFKDMPVEVIDWGIDVNLKGQMYFTRAVLPYMAEQKSGVVINIGSITGEQGSAGTPEYSTAKCGIMYGFTKSMAQYGAKYGIRVCCVSPGPVLTRANMNKMATLLGRAAEPQEVVDLVMYLTSDKAAFITGTNYLIDGGRHCMRS